MLKRLCLNQGGKNMSLAVTESAKEALQRYPVPDGKGFRLEMELTGG
jgi:hypothetical protein